LSCQGKSPLNKKKLLKIKEINKVKKQKKYNPKYCFNHNCKYFKRILKSIEKQKQDYSCKKLDLINSTTAEIEEEIKKSEVENEDIIKI